jgi:hypothetical protein
MARDKEIRWELEPKAYKVPLRLRHQAARNEARWGLGFLALSVLATAALITDRTLHEAGSYWIVGAEDPVLLASMVGLIAVSLAILGWAYFWTYRYGSVSYKVGRVKLVFTDLDYFVPHDIMAGWISKKVYDKFRPHTDEAPEVIMPDCAVILTGTDMEVSISKVSEDGRYRETKDIYGKTYPQRNVSYVEAWYVLTEGVMDWELKLQVMDELFPFQPEGDDIEWMKQHGV